VAVLHAGGDPDRQSFHLGAAAGSRRDGPVHGAHDLRAGDQDWRRSGRLTTRHCHARPGREVVGVGVEELAVRLGGARGVAGNQQQVGFVRGGDVGMPSTRPGQGRRAPEEGEAVVRGHRPAPITKGRARLIGPRARSTREPRAGHLADGVLIGLDVAQAPSDRMVESGEPRQRSVPATHHRPVEIRQATTHPFDEPGALWE